MSLKETGGGAKRALKRKGSHSTLQKEKLCLGRNPISVLLFQPQQGSVGTFHHFPFFPFSLTAAYTALPVTGKSAAGL